MKTNISLSAGAKFRFEYKIDDISGSVLALTVASALPQAKLNFARQKYGKSSPRVNQAQGNKGVADSEVSLVCAEASDDSLHQLKRTIHILVSEEGRPATLERAKLAQIVEINRALGAR